MSTRFRNITALALLFVATLLYRQELLQYYFGLSSSTVQFILVPFVLIACALFSFWKETLPLSPLVIAFIASACLGITSFGLKLEVQEKLTVYIAPFLGDDNQAQTIKYSDLIIKNFEEVGLNIGPVRLSNPIPSAKAAQDFFQKNIEKGNSVDSIILSGNPRWLTISISPELSKNLVSKPLGELLSSLGLRLATEVSSTGLSDGLSRSSRDFIARIIATFSDLNQSNLESAEMNISDAAGVLGKWSTTSHRAYALWLLGNISLSKAFSGDSLEPAYLRCAVNYFTRARRFIRKGESPELLAAVLNNRGVAHFLSYMLLNKKPLRRQALREFRTASKLAYKKSSITPNPAWLVARMNWRYFNQPKDLKRQYVKKTGKVKIKKEKQPASKVKGAKSNSLVGQPST